MNYLLILASIVLGGCGRQVISTQKLPTDQVDGSTKNREGLPEKIAPNQLAIHVKNSTAKTVYACSFSYIKKANFDRWRWDKSNIIELQPQQEADIKLDAIDDDETRNNVYGYLAVFDTRAHAEEAIYELLEDAKKIDLDLISKIQDKVITIAVEQYGFKKDRITYGFDSRTKAATLPDFNFSVENQTGQPVYVTAFVYEKKKDMPTWQYTKTPMVYLENNKESKIDVSGITNEYDWKYMRGYLGVFREDEKKEAEESTYELLDPSHKLTLGLLNDINGHKITLNAEEYGIVGNFIDYTSQPVKRIDFKSFESRRRR